MPRDKLDLLQGTLDLIVLRLLRGAPANGWDLTQAIQVVSRGVLDVNYGSIYPALRRLEARGLVKGRWATSENNRRARLRAHYCRPQAARHRARRRGAILARAR